MTRPTALTALRAAARDVWDRVRRRHRCGWPGPPGQPPCDWVLGPNDPPTCPDHTRLPNSVQDFWRRPKDSTEENP